VPIWDRLFLTGTASPILDLLHERALRGRRDDGHVICLAVEGGGMRGAAPAGMCLALERAGLVGAFDRIYGCSSGAITACFAAAGQAELWATSFEDTACRAFVDPTRLLRGRPVVDLGFLFDTVIGKRRMLSAHGLATGPEVRAIAVAERTGELRVLGGFDGVADALAAARASCAIPLVTGAPPAFRGEPMVDGGLLEPIPFRSALRDGATHVLVLRSRAAEWRSRPHRRVTERPLARAPPPLAPLYRACDRRYNAAADTLEHWPDVGPVLRQVTVEPDARLVARFSTDTARIAETVRLGAEAMAAALGTPAPALPEPAAPPRRGPALRIPRTAAFRRAF
jgi:predicted patatin/cPLA2 family phospholipase